MKKFFLTDGEIQDLIDEPKTMGCSVDSLLSGMKSKLGGKGVSHLQNSRKFPRSNGVGEWLIYLRRSKEYMFDFSCGLKFIPKGRKQAFTLIRYNGKSHYHTNRLENENPFYDFHIHRATEKYQNSSYGEEHYAIPTERYADIHGAFRCLLVDCQARPLDDRQARLFK